MSAVLSVSPFPQNKEWIPPIEYCPVSTGIRLLGDRWSLLIVRELFVGNTRFNEISRALPGLSRGLLSTRLRYLQQLDIVARNPSALDYSLTEQGRALGPVLESLGAWALQWRLPSESSDAGMVGLILWRSYQTIERSLLPNGTINIHFRFLGSAEREGWLYASPEGGGACTGYPDRPAHLTVAASIATFEDLWWGRQECMKAIKSGAITFDGPNHLARAYPGWFPNRPAVT